MTKLMNKGCNLKNYYSSLVVLHQPVSLINDKYTRGVQ